MGDSQLQDTKSPTLYHTNTHWLKSQDGEKGSSMLNSLLWIFFLNFATSFSHRFFSLLSLFLSEFFSGFSCRLWTSRGEKRVFYIIRSCFRWGFAPTKDKDEVRQLVTCFSTPSSTSSWTFPSHEESYKQLKQVACDQHVTSNEQAGKQVGVGHVT